MTEALIYLDPDSTLNLQSQIRQKLVDAILAGTFPGGSRLPSSRKLAEQLGVARNTVVLAYEQLIAEGYIESRERSGIFVNREILPDPIEPGRTAPKNEDSEQCWHQKIPLYPTAHWREASRMALGAKIFRDGSIAEMDDDDPVLIEEIRTKMLPRRGISASADQILITLGEQNALYLITHLLVDESVSVVMEEPGNPRMRQLLHQHNASIMPQPVDENGMLINTGLDEAQLIYITPSHQVPTAVTMPMQRRRALLKKARKLDQLIIEDDFEHEINYQGQPHPALRSMDTDNRVIYVSALPKVLAPGLRIGFIVAAPALIQQIRRLRQLVIGRPSLINQRTAALFLSLGHYDSFMMRLKTEMQQRWYELGEALNHYLGRSVVTIPNQGGTVFWVHAPENVDVEALTEEAARHGILIEPDTHYFAGRRKSRNWFRMGVTSIPRERIREGVRQLRDLMWDLSYGDDVMLDENDPDLLKGAALKRMMTGATLIYRTHFVEASTIVLHEDGSMTGCAGKHDEDRDSGHWWIENDIWYRQWKLWSYGEPEGYRITVKDGKINWYNQSGRLADSAEIKIAENGLA
jgi:GntR family transcriptional regulator/MocR family aminotransferase